MATEVYKAGVAELSDGTLLYITPLKIKYLRQFMDRFELVRSAKGDDQAIDALVKCTLIAMQQFYPSIVTQQQLEDAIDLPNIYNILEFSANIKINADKEEDVKTQATDSASSWDDLDLAKLEAEVFLLGIWKDYEDLESSLSMPELMHTLSSKRELDYEEKKFFAAIQGVDLDKQSGKSDPWEEMKARVFSGGKTSNPNDIASFQGAKAQKAGFGIGMGLDYEDMTK